MNITWNDFWTVFRDFILPESGTVIWSLVLYGFLGAVLAVAILATGQRYNVFTRSQKYYNWVVKLYIPLILLGTIYFALQLGLFRGIYKVTDNEASLLTEGIYSQTLDRAYATPAEKEAFVLAMKMALVTYDQSAEAYADTLKLAIMGSEVGVGLIDQAKNGVATWLIDTFKDDIFSAIMAAVLSEAAKQAGVPVEMSWSQKTKLLDVLLRTDAAHLELAIKEEITKMLRHLCYSQYSSARSSTLLMWFFIVLFVPLLEWIIYRQWIAAWLMKRRQLAEQAAATSPLTDA